MKQRGHETPSTRPTTEQRCIAAVCLIFAAAVTVEGLLTIAGVIHGINGAGEDLSTPWNVLMGLFTAAFGIFATISLVDDLRTGNWQEPSSSGENNGADEGDDPATDLDDVDDGW
ncbi:hypothetical protein ACIBK9_18115 [Nonomuraea sp. NPDC050227]|uniref:hypothetical protein n=1 Tax=Nonomuraea sp. NPDC050227 TaxID=3364360 RepID=UPI0037AE77F9